MKEWLYFYAFIHISLMLFMVNFQFLSLSLIHNVLFIPRNIMNNEFLSMWTMFLVLCLVWMAHPRMSIWSHKLCLLYINLPWQMSTSAILTWTQKMMPGRFSHLFPHLESRHHPQPSHQRPSPLAESLARCQKAKQRFVTRLIFVCYFPENDFMPQD